MLQAGGRRGEADPDVRLRARASVTLGLRPSVCMHLQHVPLLSMFVNYASLKLGGENLGKPYFPTLCVSAWA